MRTCSALRSTSLYTATLLSPSSRQARMTRSAISPRLAISTLRKGQSDVEIVCTRMLPLPGTRKGALILPRRVLHYISRVPGSLTDPASIPGTRKGCHYISRVPGSLTDPASIPGTRKGCHYISRVPGSLTDPVCYHLHTRKNRRRSGVRLFERTIAGRLHKRPDFVRLERHINGVDPQRRKSIQHGVDDSRRRANTARFADTLGTQRVGG